MTRLLAILPTPRYRVIRACTVRAWPSRFAAILVRLRADVEFIGWPAQDARWVARTRGGFVLREQLIEVGGR